MSENKPHYIPHPLCTPVDPKVSRNDLENLDQYINKSINPRWAASHIVRMMARGLMLHDIRVARMLGELASELETGGRTKKVKV